MCVCVGCYQVSFAATELEFGGDPDIFCLPRDPRVAIENGNSLIQRWTTGGDRLTFSMCSDAVSYVRCSVQFWVPGPSSVLFSTVGIPFRTPLLPSVNTAATSLSYQESLGSMGAQIFGDATTGTSCADYFAGCNVWTVPPISDPLIFWPPPSELPKFDLFGTNVYQNYFKAMSAQPLQRTFIGVIALTVGTTKVFPRSQLGDISVALTYVTNQFGEAPVLPNNAFDLNEKGPASPSVYLSTISLSSFPVIDLAKLCDETSYETLQNVVNGELTEILATDLLEPIEFHKVCCDLITQFFFYFEKKIILYFFRNKNIHFVLNFLGREGVTRGGDIKII